MTGLSLALALALGSGGAAQAGPLFTPAAPSVVAGTSFTVTLSDTILVADTIAAVDLEVDFDPTVLSLDGATDGALLPGWSITTSPSSGWSRISNTSNAVAAFISAAEPVTATADANGTGSVVVLDFTALAGSGGSTSVSVQGTAQGVFGEYQLPPVSFGVDITAPTIAVPAPGPTALLLPALALVLACGRRRMA